MLGVFRNTLTPNDNYLLEDCENLLSPIQMQLYLKPIKLFETFFFHLWNLHQILNILKKRMIAIPTLFRKLQNVKDLVRPLSKKHRSRTLLDSQHVKESPTLAKPACDHFHHIFPRFWETLNLKISPLVIC